MLWNSVSWIDALGYAASLTVFATFCMGTMMPRMATITCKTDCYYYEMRGSRVKELYFQQPAFAYAVLQMIVGRLLENLENQKAAVSSGAGE